MPIEVTTYRSDGKYSDHRAPDSVRYVSSVDDDLRRRDFTVNAVCCSEEGKIYDPLNGVADICSKKLRTVGEPEKRFSEDALRKCGFSGFHHSYVLKLKRNLMKLP